MPEVLEEACCRWCQKVIPEEHAEQALWENGYAYCDIICAESDMIEDD